jgi:hypothetical protein
MATSPVFPKFGPNRGFVTWSKVREGTRLGVVRVGREVAGSGFTNPNFTLRLGRENELPFFMGRRIDVTVSKLMYAAAQLFAEGRSYAPLAIEGAKVQHGRGNSAWRRIGGKSYLTGTDAAHYGIGTVTRMGEALSVQAARHILVWKATPNLPEDDPRAEFPASGLLAGYGLAHDASTYLAPAFINQAEGALEDAKHPLLVPFLPLVIPRSPEELERTLVATGVRLAEFLAEDPEAVIRPLNDRLSVLRQNIGANEYLQDPADVDNALFGGAERNLLEAMRGAIQDPGSEFHDRVESVVKDVPLRAQELTELAVMSREEREADSAAGSSSGSSAGS